jgi:hypothetical protein
VRSIPYCAIRTGFRRWGEFGDGPGQFMRGPHGGWMEADGSLYVAEASVNNRLQKVARV